MSRLLPFPLLVLNLAIPLAAAPRERTDYTWEQVAKLAAAQRYEIGLRGPDAAASNLRVSGSEIHYEDKGGAQHAPLADLRHLRETSGQRVRLSISGARLEGTLVEVQPRSLVLWVAKTSDKARYPKGIALVPREQAAAMELVSARGHSVLIGTLAGLGAGAGIGAAVAQATPEEGIGVIAVPAGAAAVAAIGTVAGYFIGRSRRWRTTEIRIVGGP